MTHGIPELLKENAELKEKLAARTSLLQTVLTLDFVPEMMRKRIEETLK